MKITIKVTYIMYFDDYHEIYEFVDRFNDLTGGKSKLKFTEIMGESDYGYKALFYFGKQDKAYKNALKAYRESVKEDDYEI
jgi:hypothetical protein